jgi:hypothetical protein
LNQAQPPWRFGGYFEWGGVSTGSSDQATLLQEYFQAYRFGIRGQWHARPTRTIDPWLGASFGPFVTTDLQLLDHSGGVAGRWGVDLGVDAGIDFHVGVFTFGPVFTLVVPFGPTAQPGPETDPSPATPVGAYFSAWAGVVPFPLLRVGATF